MIKGINKTIKNEKEKQKDDFVGMLLGTLNDSLLGNLLTSKGMKGPNIHGWGVIREGEDRIIASKVIDKAGKGTIRASQAF